MPVHEHKLQAGHDKLMKGSKVVFCIILCMLPLSGKLLLMLVVITNCPAMSQQGEHAKKTKSENCTCSVSVERAQKRLNNILHLRPSCLLAFSAAALFAVGSGGTVTLLACLATFLSWEAA